LGVGYGGHTYFAHTVSPTDTDHIVTGTWTPPATVTGYQQIFVHLPPNGADTAQAPYTITTGNGETETRVVNQRWNANTWVSLGVFNLKKGANSVSLSNASYQDYLDGNVDISFDAIAYSKTVAQPEYVALGDSYSAGEGLQPFLETSDIHSDGSLPTNACHRSATQAYPESVARALSITDFHFLACSGATTGSIDSALDSSATFVGPWGEQPQLTQGYLDSHTTLVTLTIGGNDARFADVLKGCIAALEDCDGPGYYLTTSAGVDPKPLIQYEPIVINNLLGPLEIAYGDIKAAAPNATIDVIGYPHLLPASDAIAELDCPITMGLLPDSAQWLNSMADLLDSVIQQAASAEGVHYIDPRSAFTGHDACSAAPWINGVIAVSSSGSGTNIPGSGTFHPNSTGASELATVVLGA
jgi:lysophospholipase L1-like esterase